MICKEKLPGGLSYEQHCAGGPTVPGVISLSLLIWKQSPFLCSIQTICCPRNPLFIDKETQGSERSNNLLFSPPS